MIATTREVGAAEGFFVAPEGAACFVAVRKLVAAEKIGAEESVVIFNTGSGIKYLECYDMAPEFEGQSDAKAALVACLKFGDCDLTNLFRIAPHSGFEIRRSRK